MIPPKYSGCCVPDITASCCAVSTSTEIRTRSACDRDKHNPHNISCDRLATSIRSLGLFVPPSLIEALLLIFPTRLLILTLVRFTKHMLLFPPLLVCIQTRNPNSVHFVYFYLCRRRAFRGQLCRATYSTLMQCMKSQILAPPRHLPP